MAPSLGLVALLLAFQPPGVERSAESTPPSRDTVGYWQQDISYRIVATLDEPRGALSATAELTYVNHSPDTLREFFVQQYLNAFRPGSRWSAADEREGRERFQHLRDPDYGYERFTAPPTFDGVAALPDYPGAPDSTVAHFRLPAPLAPGDSVRVTFQWAARPSTLPRRQGRRGRSFDFAEWYPKVAVYDRDGWEANALVPAGEFYGEYGTYDVTLVLRDDQVVGGTGVVVGGDPGWQRVLRAGTIRDQAGVYGPVPPGPAASVPAGFKAVRFFARDIHEFAWSTSPDYRYEGAVLVHMATSRLAVPVFDTVAINILYRPGDESTWGNGVAVARVQSIFASLEGIYGPYAYPVFTALHRIEGGGTEFPMMVMAEAPAFLPHETGHQFAMAALGDNEWRSAWMDEGLTGYLGGVMAGNTAQDRRAPPPEMAPSRPGYRGLADRPDAGQASQISQQHFVHVGLAEPPATPSQSMRDFNIYNTVIYTPMYGALRDLLGDSLFRAFLRDYYARWVFRHVDEQAMRGSAERVYGRDLGWFFDQWIHEVGNVDYALTSVESRRDGTGWVTRARVVRRGAFRHPMPVGARVGTAWTVARIDPLVDAQWVELRTAAKPTEVILDPFRVTMDWDRRNDLAPWHRIGAVDFVPDWPFLEQSSATRTVAALSPVLLDSRAGGVALGVRARVNYQGTLSRIDKGMAVSVGAGGRDPGLGDATRWVSAWSVIDNPRMPFTDHPAMGLRLGAWYVDDAARLDISKRWDVSRYTTGTVATRTLGVTWIWTNGLRYLSDGRWDDGSLAEATLTEERRWARSDSLRARITLAGGAADPRAGAAAAYGRVETEGSARRVLSGGAAAVSIRVYGGVISDRTPRERRLHLASADPVETFANHWLRPAGAPLARQDVHYVALGDGALRGYAPTLTLRNLGALNLDASRRALTLPGTGRPPSIWLDVFGDLGAYVGRTSSGSGRATRWLGDAGVGVAVRGQLMDREIRIRMDAPILVRHPAWAVGAGPGDNAVRWRWTFSTADLW